MCEVEEECGLELELSDFLWVWEYVNLCGKIVWFFVVFVLVECVVFIFL